MRSSKSPNVTSWRLKAIDADFREAGLSRGIREPKGKNAVRQQAGGLEESTLEELHLDRPVPRLALNGVQWLPVSGWDSSWLWSGFSTRLGGLSRAYCPEDAPGELNLGLSEADNRQIILSNRRSLAEAVSGTAQTPLVTLRQFHSNLLVHVGAADATREQPHKGDGLMTNEPGLLLAIQTADCIPILIADRRRRAVAAFHAGWRGTVKRIVEEGVGRMRLEFGSRPEDLVVAIGPGIGACCYAVGEEVLTEFESQFTYARDLFREVYDADPVRKKYPMLFLTQRAPGHSPIGPSLHLDLIEANRRQLLDAGLSPQAIQIAGGCTQCHSDLFFSHRGSRGHAGRMMAVIGINAAQKAGRRRS